MNSLRHVFWRGAMALSLMAVGIGSGFGFREAPLQAGAKPDGCAARRAVHAAGIDAPALGVDRALDVAQRLRVERRLRRG